MNKIKGIGIGIFCIIVGVALLGCVPKGDYEALHWELDNLAIVYAELEIDHSELEANYNQLELELKAKEETLATLSDEQQNLRENYNELETKYNQLQTESAEVEQELAKIKQSYPPGDFSSVAELEEWMRENVHPQGEYIEDTFRLALKVQSQGLKDGYLISVVYDEDDKDPEQGWMMCGALVNGQLYHWCPWDTWKYSVEGFMR